MEYQQPKTGNVVDAIYRGFAGPDIIGFGEPGKPGLVWTTENDERMASLQEQAGDLGVEMGRACRDLSRASFSISHG